MCIIEWEKFIVSVRVIGVRVIFDFLDNIYFLVGFVKYIRLKILLVRNIGNSEVKFIFSVEA